MLSIIGKIKRTSFNVKNFLQSWVEVKVQIRKVRVTDVCRSGRECQSRARQGWAWAVLTGSRFLSKNPESDKNWGKHPVCSPTLPKGKGAGLPEKKGGGSGDPGTAGVGDGACSSPFSLGNTGAIPGEKTVSLAVC